ncbi:MAG: hypothetical protein GYB24_05250 [Rhodobacteraceae bacterium]|nr:hypothetical protein [Paracoccaceae bacterium]
MTDSPPDVAKSGKGMKLIAVLLLAGFVAGTVAGVFAYKAMAPTQTEKVEVVEKVNMVQVDVGRITLSLQAGNGGIQRHLLVNPIVLLEETDSEDGLSSDEMKALLRDSFVEYLSQLSVRDVSGSAGMSIMRSELKRRAAARLEDRTVSRILFQDFVIQ